MNPDEESVSSGATPLNPDGADLPETSALPQAPSMTNQDGDKERQVADAQLGITDKAGEKVTYGSGDSILTDQSTSQETEDAVINSSGRNKADYQPSHESVTPVWSDKPSTESIDVWKDIPEEESHLYTMGADGKPEKAEGEQVGSPANA